MRRHHHLLERTFNVRFPTQVVALDVDCALVGSPSGPREQRYTLNGWHCAGMSGNKGEYGPTHNDSGPDAASWWAAVAYRLRKGGDIWCACQGATRVVSVLGLWDLIEERQWSVCAGDSRDNHGANAGQGARNKGVVCLEDPPFILDVRPAGRPGKLRILDVENYGVDCPPPTGNAAERCHRWLAFMRDMIGALRSHGMGGLQCTSASQSMASFKHGFLGLPIICHSNEDALNLEDASYVGGRCEAFSLGAIAGRIWHLDVSAMYPTICQSARIPVSLLGIRDGGRLDYTGDHNEEVGLLGTVGIDTPEPDYPKKDARLGLTVYPVGTFTTTLCGPELKDAYDKGRITKVHRVASYGTDYALRAYAGMLVRLRGLPGGSADFVRWAKSLGVCVVGKLGQKFRRWRSAVWPAHCEPWQQWYVGGEGIIPAKWRSVAWHTQVEEVGGFSFDAVPSAAAWITSLGRMQLLALIRCAGRHNVHYCDTDSLFVNDAGHSRLCVAGMIGDGEPGRLRFKEVSDSVHIYGIKTYTFGGREVAAGKPADVDYYGSEGARVWVAPRAAGGARAGEAPQAKRTSVPFGRACRYQHGHRELDGTVRPLRYDHDQLVPYGTV